MPGSGEISRSKSLPPSGERSRLERDRLEGRRRSLPNPERNGDLFAEFNFRLLPRESSNNGPTENNIRNIIQSSYPNELIQNSPDQPSSKEQTESADVDHSDASLKLPQKRQAEKDLSHDKAKRPMLNTEKTSQNADTSSSMERDQVISTNLVGSAGVDHSDASLKLPQKRQADKDLSHGEEKKVMLDTEEISQNADTRSSIDGNVEIFTDYVKQFINTVIETFNSASTLDELANRNIKERILEQMKRQAEGSLSYDKGKKVMLDTAETSQDADTRPSIEGAFFANTVKQFMLGAGKQFILEAGKAKLQESQEFINTVRETFTNSAPTVDGLANWKVNDHIQKQITEWKKNNPNVQEPRPGTIYYDLNVAKKTMLDLTNKSIKVLELRGKIISEIQALYAHKFPQIDSFNPFLSDKELTSDNDVNVHFIQDVLYLQLDIAVQQFDQVKDNLLESATLQLNKIDESMNKLGMVPAMLEVKRLELLVQRLGHPIFLEGEMRDADVGFEVPLRGKVLGGGLAHMVTTLLKEQGIDLSAEYGDEYEYKVSEALGVHPYGDGVSREQLERGISELGDKKGYHFQNIGEKDLVKALEKGPVGVLLKIDRLANVPMDCHFEHYVTLARREWDNMAWRYDVVVIDELRTVPHNPFISELGNGYIVKPYKININRLKERGWNGDVFIQKEIYNAIRPEEVNEVE